MDHLKHIYFFTFISCYTTVHNYLFICIIIHHAREESLTILIIVENIQLYCLN